jgi:MFS family permease
MGLFSSLNREQKEALGLLQIGTFLEYFDLMLYIHMAVLLNELFFPKTDPHTASLLTAFAFCSTYVMRPVGALIFGWLGDNIGRKSTIIITTVMMSVSCMIMANLPTYAQIGISAAWIMTLCRIAQGMSSMGEIMGAGVYMAETVPRPASYPAVAFIAVASSLGSLAAVGIASLVTSFLLNWRLAFWIGAGLGLIGAVARTRLRETPDFLEMKRQKLKADIAASHKHLSEKERQPPFLSWKERIRFKNLMSFFLVYCGWPLTFYLAFIYFNPVLKRSFGYSPEEIIQHNFFLSVILLISCIFYAYLSSRIHPIKIIKIRGTVALLLMIAMPFLVQTMSSPLQLFTVQSLLLLFQLSGMPADAVFFYHLPISRRVTYAGFLFAVTRALIYVITSFGLVYLESYFGPFGIWFITLPITFAFLYGSSYFESLERKTGHFLKPLYKT